MEELQIHSASNSYLDDLYEELGRILAEIRPWSEDLYESEYYFEKRWLEVRNSNEAIILHIFRSDGEYLESTNGNILTGKWSILENSNTMILECPTISGKAEKTLYDLSFLNKDFFILKKHGTHKSFLVLGRDQLVSGMNLEEVIDLISAQYSNNKSWIKVLFVIVLVVALFFLFRDWT
ncbi:MAG: hypothetical protein KJP00_13240 [Bacteroidia bacterium]|nr:hypothetical protein [Bacteroidia bacterium]